MNRELHRFVLLMAAVGFVTGFTGRIDAASLKQICITGISNQVELLVPGRAACPAALRTVVGEGTVVKTGRSSRAELTFADQTVVRLAANTLFSFKHGGRDLIVGEGEVLVESPKGGQSAKIHGGKISAAIAGTTVMFEYHPGVCKFLVLQGTARLYRPGHLGDSVLVDPGQMVIGNPSDPVSDPVDFDIGRFVKTSRFIVDLPSLPSEGLIAVQARKQQGEKSSKTLIETNMVIYGGGTLVSLINPADRTNVKSTAPTATRSPAPANSRSP